MKKLTILGIVTCLVMLLVPVAGMSAPAGPPTGLDVNILNQPVGVTGDVNVTNTPDVNVANTPDVKVTNDANNPVPVSIIDGSDSSVTPVFIKLQSGPALTYYYEVPEGYILRTSHISIELYSEATTNEFWTRLYVAEQDETSTWGSIAHFVFTPFVGPYINGGVRDFWVHSAPLEVTLQPGQRLNFGAGIVGVEVKNCFAEISAVLIPIK